MQVDLSLQILVTLRLWINFNNKTPINYNSFRKKNKKTKMKKVSFEKLFLSNMQVSFFS